MKYKWDNKKAAENLEKHGVAFEAVHGFEWDTAPWQAKTLEKTTASPATELWG